MKASLFTVPLTSLSLILIGGCQNYSFSINNNEVYTPPPLFSQFQMDDKALDTCIRQSIADQKVHKIEQLLSLNCSSAGITSVKGLEQFAWIEKLDLSDNQISDPSPLRKLVLLKYLKMTDNDGLNCAELPQTTDAFKIEIISPHHCQRTGS